MRYHRVQRIAEYLTGEEKYESREKRGVDRFVLWQRMAKVLENDMYATLVDTKKDSRQ